MYESDCYEFSRALKKIRVPVNNKPVTHQINGQHTVEFSEILFSLLVGLVVDVISFPVITSQYG